jgi:hypothetical protein
MTQPSDPNEARPQAPSVPAQGSLDAYVRENHLRYSETALREALLAAGHPRDAVDAALARHRGDAGSVGQGRSWARLLFFIYLGVFALFSVGMLTNIGSPEFQYAGSFLAIVIWAIVLAAGYGLSMIWVRSRRAGLVIMGAAVALYGASSAGSGGLAGPVALVIGLAIIGAAIAFGDRFGRAFSTSAPVILSIPLLILLALGGACVATGLPIPGGV